MTAINPAPIGSLLKGPKPVKAKRHELGRKPRIEEPKHLEAIRQLPCLICGLDAGCEAAHVRLGGGPGKPNPGMQQKPDDKFTVPLCINCHREQHSMGEEKFWDAQGIKPLMVCAELHALSPDIAAMRAYVHKFRSGL